MSILGRATGVARPHTSCGLILELATWQQNLHRFDVCNVRSTTGRSRRDGGRLGADASSYSITRFRDGRHSRSAFSS